MAPIAMQVDMLEDELDRWLRGAMPPEAANVSHPATEATRWASILQWLESALEGPVHVAHAADAVGLSSSRFMHWFAEASGLSFRAYVRWLRLQRAVRTLSDGCTLTEAAHLAGFADSAHLTRTFVSTFGVRPAALRGARIVCTSQSKPPLTLHGLEFVDTTLHGRRQIQSLQEGIS
ncbi:helix-turn-helix domain-containing protein (plasmid) [Cupriavidus sp. P-10]|uniref:helix-turn-helix transcriptional regulator n=1 Tax=Cupriavidus sp. P-10 TaxID=2027911 RepID=UPI001314BBB7|nr:AraC family transcriptional regulator [Cupriavidus sp. P-10]BDB29208.1 helix-turn-helix domain-containing protein [Cupriavidus sp. P-10]